MDMAADGERSRCRREIPELPPDLWSWLIRPPAVRPDVVADVRARLLAGERRTALEVAEALLTDEVPVGAAEALGTARGLRYVPSFARRSLVR
jgi:hypothetical protein